MRHIVRYIAALPPNAANKNSIASEVRWVLSFALCLSETVNIMEMKEIIAKYTKK